MRPTNNLTQRRLKDFNVAHWDFVEYAYTSVQSCPVLPYSKVDYSLGPVSTICMIWLTRE